MYVLSFLLFEYSVRLTLDMISSLHHTTESQKLKHRVTALSDRVDYKYAFTLMSHQNFRFCILYALNEFIIERYVLLSTVRITPFPSRLQLQTSLMGIILTWCPANPNPVLIKLNLVFLRASLSHCVPCCPKLETSSEQN